MARVVRLLTEGFESMFLTLQVLLNCSLLSLEHRAFLSLVVLLLDAHALLSIALDGIRAPVRFLV